MKIIEVSTNNIYLLELFIANLGKAKLSFRYYNNRPLSVIQMHIATLLLLDNDENPICYGHLDKEAETVWLGLAIIETHIGKGLSSIMMNALLDKARINNVKILKVSIDINNTPSIRMCENAGFSKKKISENIVFMEKHIL